VFALLVWFLVIGRVVVYVTSIEHQSWSTRWRRQNITDVTGPAAP
jgi:hypothetical protein